MPTAPRNGTLEIRPLAPSRVADVRTVLGIHDGALAWDLGRSVDIVFGDPD